MGRPYSLPASITCATRRLRSAVLYRSISSPSVGTSAILGSLAFMLPAYRAPGPGGVPVGRAIGAIATGAACAAATAIALGATAGPGVAIVAAAFGLCTGTGMALGAVARRRRAP